jgi:hypothetical protein
VLGEQCEGAQEKQEQQKQADDACYYVDPERFGSKKFKH